MSTFVRVVEAGSFKKASDTLDVPPATVTRLIQGLEGDLGVRLLHRTTRSISVTAEGAVYYERVVRLLSDLDDIEAATKQSRTTPSGRIRVETASSLGTTVLVPALSAFYERYPNIEVDLGLGTRAVDLVADGVDCAIRTGVVVDQSVAARVIGESRLIVCASPGYLGTHGTPAVPDDLQSGHRLIGLVAGGGRPMPFRFAPPDGTGATEFDGPYRLLTNDTNAYIAAGKCGLGIIRAPGHSVQSALHDGQLVAILVDYETASAPVTVLYPPNRFLSAKVRVFIDWVAELFEGNPDLRRHL